MALEAGTAAGCVFGLHGKIEYNGKGVTTKSQKPCLTYYARV